MPDDIYRFVDVFGGGFNVGININAKEIIYSDVIKEVVELLQFLYQTPIDVLLLEIDELIDEFSLDKSNVQGYLSLREYYNNEYKYPIIFYVLICHSFGNQIRFNNKGEFNLPFGKRTFNPSLRKRFIEFNNKIINKKIQFYNRDFRELRISNLLPNDFIYCDPPYLNTTATYNENKGWTIDDEDNLRNMLINLNDKEIRFGLSNNATVNADIIEWAEKNGFYIYHLNMNYKNCNYQKKNREKDDEVYITNWIKS